MKILSWNVNGIRAVEKNNFLENLKQIDADIVCLQEIKAHPSQLSSNLRDLPNYHSLFNPAQRRGYAGTAIYSKLKPSRIENKIGIDRFDEEGRFLELTFSDFVLINIYMPHGGRRKENMDYKLTVYSRLAKFLGSGSNKDVILVGDFNVAHKEVDLARPRQNNKNTMFTPQERTKIDELINLGFVDSFRMLNQEGGHYSWFPYGFSARERNLGWRIDYAFIPSKLKSRVRNTSILKGVDGSDHCPVLLEIDL